MRQRAGSGWLQATMLVVAALLSVIDVASKAIADRLVRVREARWGGLGWLDALRVSAQPVIAGGSYGHLTEHVETRRLKVDGTNWVGAAGTSDLTSEAVDMQGWDGVRFIAGFGAIVSGAVTSIKVRQGAQANMSDGADLAGSKIDVADDDDNQIAISDIFRPTERYVDVVFDRGTQNATVDFLIVELYGPLKKPVSHGATVVAAEKHASPAEGTA